MPAEKTRLAQPAALAAALLLSVVGLAPGQGPELGPPAARARQTPAAIPLPRLPTVQSNSPVTPARFQPPGRARPFAPRGADDSTQGVYQIQLEPPGLERLLLSLTSDADLQERIRQETYGRNPDERVVFPEEPILSRDRYYGRGAIWPQRGVIAEPFYVCYNRLFFEDKNAERYGWELGMLQPFVSTGLFLWDTALLPMHYFTDPCRKNDCSVGHCLPGDPTPFRLYPLEITGTGVVGELAVILALVAMFP
jgi:hypothetical protein